VRNDAEWLTRLRQSQQLESSTLPIMLALTSLVCAWCCCSVESPKQHANDETRFVGKPGSVKGLRTGRARANTKKVERLSHVLRDLKRPENGVVISETEKIQTRV
jgi:hypothetical protein